MFGINATADLTNRLAVGADASLFSHDGTSHQAEGQQERGRRYRERAVPDRTSPVTPSSGSPATTIFGSRFPTTAACGSTRWRSHARRARSVFRPDSSAFRPTQNASSNPNTLDDYEEGSWTPRIDGTTTAGVGTYGTQTGSYTKIGNKVTVTGNLALSSHTGTGSMVIANLPFAQGAGAAGGRELSRLQSHACRRAGGGLRFRNDHHPRDRIQRGRGDGARDGRELLDAICGHVFYVRTEGRRPVGSTGRRSFR